MTDLNKMPDGWLEIMKRRDESPFNSDYIHPDTPRKNRCGNDKCNEINSGIDECIKPLIKSLNENGMETIASCCGHGNCPGNIALKDGREIVIYSDHETVRRIDKIFPDIHGIDLDQQWNSLCWYVISRYGVHIFLGANTHWPVGVDINE